MRDNLSTTITKNKNMWRDHDVIPRLGFLQFQDNFLAHLSYLREAGIYYAENLPVWTRCVCLYKSKNLSLRAFYEFINKYLYIEKIVSLRYLFIIRLSVSKSVKFIYARTIHSAPWIAGDYIVLVYLKGCLNLC